MLKLAHLIYFVEQNILLQIIYMEGIKMIYT